MLSWIESPEFHFVMVAFGIVMIVLGIRGYSRETLPRSKLLFVLVASVAWIAYSIADATAFLSLSNFISSLFTGVLSLLFISLFFYWGYTRQGS
ncbi:hypothetical protein C486_17220 [Natrinema gari JCM 14663]|uniref:Uncharacterized protein n=1 Tax=Natrinema gari JCM 14663 TaxID=1230459 RepID=L9YUP7_9EURY|nr:hypothetical protein C486_17220 [Natrinema gari JCM 14663]